MKKKVIIFGASLYGEIAYNVLKGKYEIIGFADNDPKKWGNTFNGKKVFSPKELIAMENLEIIIASQYYSAISIQLFNMGLKEIKVFYYCGNPQLDTVYDKGYELYPVSNKKMFEDCVYDKEKIGKIKKNFSENYNLSQSSEKIELKETNRKRVLFCAYIFPPLGGAGVQRSLKFVKYLRKFGYEPIVLTVGKHSNQTGEDYTLLDEVEDVQIIRIDLEKFLPEALSKEEQQEIFNLYAGIIQSEEWLNTYSEIINNGNNLKLIPDNQICWVNDCLRQIEEKVNLSEIDIVFTTGQPFSAFILGYYLKNKYRMKWVQDYRDPWGSNDFYIKNYYQNDTYTMKLQQQLEKVLVSASDAIIVVAKGLINEFAEKYRVDKNKIIEITNGYDEDDFKSIVVPEVQNSKFTLCYNGSLYGDRTPLNLLKALNNLIEKDYVKKDSVIWTFNGTIENRWKRELEENDKYNIIRYTGYLDHLQSIKKAMKADVLLFFGLEGKGAEIGYSGKIFEYIRMQKPILAFSGNGGVVDEMLIETKTGVNFEYEDIENIEKHILELYRNWKNDKNDFSPDSSKIQKYSRENITKMLSEVFDKLL